MDTDIDRNLGEQSIAKIMVLHGLSAHDLVANSTRQITHKMVARAVKGRRLTPNIKRKVLNAFNKAAGKEYQLKNIFNY